MNTEIEIANNISGYEVIEVINEAAAEDEEDNTWKEFTSKGCQTYQSENSFKEETGEGETG